MHKIIHYNSNIKHGHTSFLSLICWGTNIRYIAMVFLFNDNHTSLQTLLINKACSFNFFLLHFLTSYKRSPKHYFVLKSSWGFMQLVGLFKVSGNQLLTDFNPQSCLLRNVYCTNELIVKTFHYTSKGSYKFFY